MATRFTDFAHADILSWSPEVVIDRVASNGEIYFVRNCLFSMFVLARSKVEERGFARIEDSKI